MTSLSVSLTVFFGLIGLAGFLFGIFQQYEARRSAEQQKIEIEKLTREVAALTEMLGKFMYDETERYGRTPRTQLIREVFGNPEDLNPDLPDSVREDVKNITRHMQVFGPDNVYPESFGKDKR